jgi:hypothetical protein
MAHTASACSSIANSSRTAAALKAAIKIRSLAHQRFVAAGKLNHDASDIVLTVRLEPARSLRCMVREFVVMIRILAHTPDGSGQMARHALKVGFAGGSEAG